MPIMRRLRAYHAVLAVLVILAYATGELGVAHAWLGYGVAAVILVRLVWATAGVPQLGLARFYPVFQGLKLGNAMTHPAISRTLLAGIAACLIGATASGVMMDGGRSLRVDAQQSVAPAFAERDNRDRDKDRRRGDDRSDSALGEVHEALANLLIALVVVHVGYLVMFKRPLARFMLFLDTPKG